jgi:hypothetical protein
MFSPILRITLTVYTAFWYNAPTCCRPDGSKSVHCTKKLYIVLKYAWRWAKTSSETRRIRFKKINKRNLLHPIGYLHRSSTKCQLTTVLQIIRKYSVKSDDRMIKYLIWEEERNKEVTVIRGSFQKFCTLYVFSLKWIYFTKYIYRPSM